MFQILPASSITSDLLIDIDLQNFSMMGVIPRIQSIPENYTATKNSILSHIELVDWIDILDIFDSLKPIGTLAFLLAMLDDLDLVYGLADHVTNSMIDVNAECPSVIKQIVMMTLK